MENVATCDKQPVRFFRIPGGTSGTVSKQMVHKSVRKMMGKGRHGVPCQESGCKDLGTLLEKNEQYHLTDGIHECHFQKSYFKAHQLNHSPSFIHLNQSPAS